MPALVTYQILDSAHASGPTTERGAIERLALACLHFGRIDSLGATVIETRYNVVRSNVPHTVASARRLRDYLPAADAASLLAARLGGQSPRLESVDAELVVGPWRRPGLEGAAGRRVGL